ncbi:MAG: hypothetical protein QXX95_05225 [Nitrososphaerales archaeon]
MNRRINRLNISLDDTLINSNDPISIAVYAKGIKGHKSGEGIRRVGRLGRAI